MDNVPIKNALKALPEYLRDSFNKDDKFAFYRTPGDRIESKAALLMNRQELRSIWDPDGQYFEYHFVHQPSVFPDLTLRKIDDSSICLIGVEVKSWHILSKEGVPTFRCDVTASACYPHDLICVIPYVVDTDGQLEVLLPFVESLKYCIEKRNDHWIRTLKKKVVFALDAVPYAPKRSRILDHPDTDPGNNFGRLARCRIPEFDSWTETIRTAWSAHRATHRVGDAPYVAAGFDLVRLLLL